MNSAKMKVLGFTLKKTNSKKYYYIDCNGINSIPDKWKIDCFYTPDCSHSIFFDTENEYNEFKKEIIKVCYTDYKEFVKDYNSAINCKPWMKPDGLR